MSAWGIDRVYVPASGETPPRAPISDYRDERVVLLSAETSPVGGLPGMAETVRDCGAKRVAVANLLQDFLDFGVSAFDSALTLIAHVKPTLCIWHVRMGWRIPPKLPWKIAMAVKSHGGTLVVWCDDPGHPSRGASWWVPMLEAADLVLLTNCDQPRWLRGKGSAATGYLLPAYYPETFKPCAPQPELDAAWFVGNNYYGMDGGDREEAMGAVRSAIGDRLVLAGAHWGRVSGGGFSPVPILTFRVGASTAKLFLGMGLRDGLRRYTSDRMTRAMGCGAVYAFRAFPDFEGMGIEDGKHALSWRTTEDLVELVRDWMRPERAADRAAMRVAAASLAQKRWTWQAWLEHLMAIVKVERAR